jgi:hypothetical protein
MLLAAIAVMLGACSSGGSVNLGRGQAVDPATDDFPIAYVKRTIPMLNGQLREDDLRRLRVAVPNAALWVRDRASPTAPERNITQRVTGDTDLYDIKGVNPSPDGKKIIFAMRGPLQTNQNEKREPFWGIWEYDIAADLLRRVIDSDTIAAEGNDVAPAYLPDQRIVFSSTRQRQSQAILRDEGKPGYEAQTDTRNESAFVLHVMNADGTDLHQISFNQSSDNTPTVLQDGRLLWSRWDGATGRGIHLYTANPDGTNLQLLYGARSHQTGSDGATIQFTQAREMQDGRILALTRPFSGTSLGGDLMLIDTRNYVENTQPLATNAGMTGPAQTRATPNQVSTLPGPSPDGRFIAAFPLWDGTHRILVSWSQCRLMDRTTTPATIVPCTNRNLADPNAEEALPLYSAFMFDPAGNTFRPVFTPVEGVMITDIVAAQPRPLPTVLLDKLPLLDFDPDLQRDAVGILDIRSVYDFDGSTRNTGTGNPSISQLANPGMTPADQRPARFLRLEKPVSIGDRDLGFPNLNNAAFGTVNNMREILGYVPIEPDGSVRVRVPSNVAFVISILDADGRRLFPAHRNWLQLRPGETRQCNGCHQAATGNALDLSHGREGTATSVWAGGSGNAAFPGTQDRFTPLLGETMAQARSRWSCQNDACRSEIPSVDLSYSDEWTEPTTAGRAPDAPLTYPYSGAMGLTTPAPTPPGCMTAWNSVCRIIINYTQHLHPLWSVNRDIDTCTNCHNTRDAMAAVQVPAGQLDLTDGDSNEQPLHKNTYRKLLFSHNQQEVNMGALQDIVITDPDTGQTSTPTVPPPLSAGNARGSTRFFSLFAPGGSHAGRLTPAELRLISEWVDIGAQYFNDPFDPAVPLN